MKTVLVLAPHTDDGEFACGATLAKLVDEGCIVHYTAFSTCEESVPTGESPDILRKEVMEATKAIGIPESNVHIFDYRVRHFNEHRQEILDDLIKLRVTISPDVVFMPSMHDIHQDHNTIAMEGLRAFKKETIYAYEVVWNNFSFDNQVFICVNESHVDKKINAIKCYNSQSKRDYAKEEFIRGLLITHGVQIGVRFAEVFEAPRIVIK